jgi:hypothetical protein
MMGWRGRAIACALGLSWLSAGAAQAQGDSVAGVVIHLRSRVHISSGSTKDSVMSSRMVLTHGGARVLAEQFADTGAAAPVRMVYDVATHTMRSASLPGMVVRMRLDSLRTTLERLGQIRFDSLSITAEPLGAGPVTLGLPTRRVRVTSRFRMRLGVRGTAMSTTMVQVSDALVTSALDDVVPTSALGGRMSAGADEQVLDALFGAAADSASLRQLARTRGVHLWSARSQTTTTTVDRGASVTQVITDTSVAESVERVRVPVARFTFEPSLREVEFAELMGGLRTLTDSSASSPARDDKPASSTKAAPTPKPRSEDKLPPAPPKGAAHAFRPPRLPP